jgi:hypothetical protein
MTKKGIIYLLAQIKVFASYFLFGRAGAAAETTHANKYRRRAVGLYAAMAGNQRKRYLAAPPS